MALMRPYRPGREPTYAVCYTGIEEGAAIASVVATVASTAVSVAASQQQASARQAELNYQSQALQSQAQAERGAASYSAYQQARRTALLEERAQAVSAASGGSATDKSALGIVGNIAKQGSYNTLMDIATGEQKARGLETQAGADTFEAGQIGAALPLQQLGTVLDGATSIYKKYGQGGPSNSNVNTAFLSPAYDPLAAWPGATSGPPT